MIIIIELELRNEDLNLVVNLRVHFNKYSRGSLFGRIGSKWYCNIFVAGLGN
jgi:hypothetical protein